MVLSSNIRALNLFFKGFNQFARTFLEKFIPDLSPYKKEQKCRWSIKPFLRERAVTVVGVQFMSINLDYQDKQDL